MFVGAHPTLTRSLAEKLLPQRAFATTLFSPTGAENSFHSTPFNPDLVWEKVRNNTDSHQLYDSARGSGKVLRSNTTAAEAIFPAGYAELLSGGFTDAGFPSDRTEVAWAFKFAKNFCTAVTYTGDGTSGRQIPHGLGIPPGMVIIKNRSAATPWPVRHRSLTGSQEVLSLNTTDAVTASSAGFDTFANSHTASYFAVSGNAQVNASGQTYVAYLFAHDPDPVNGIVQCGSVTIPGSGNGVATLGWVPQFVLWKNSGSAGPWRIVDTARGFSQSTGVLDPVLNPNSSAAEDASFDYIRQTSDGFILNVAAENPNQTFVYLAIRAPI